VEVGCFADKQVRAIAGGYERFARNVVIQKCQEKAKIAGNSHFAVQNGVECFTSHTAGKTYDKYGRTSGCMDGRGGHWRMSVYEIPFSSVEVGCFTDKKVRAIAGGYQRFARNVVIQKCQEKAKIAGNSHFAVQNGVECFTSPDAGITYDKYGKSSGCMHGRGGHWRMTVYRIPPRSLPIGCFADKIDRAISGGIVTFDRDLVIQKCQEKALKVGNNYFAVQNGVQCFTSLTAGKTYDKYGRTTGCMDGRGGHWRMSVYQIPRPSVEVGCFIDKRARAISGGYVTFATHLVIQKCEEKAKRAGNSFFAVQNSVECFTSPGAGKTHDKYGRSTGCKHGRGGHWRMTVYRII